MRSPLSALGIGDIARAHPRSHLRRRIKRLDPSARPVTELVFELVANPSGFVITLLLDRGEHSVPPDLLARIESLLRTNSRQFTITKQDGVSARFGEKAAMRASFAGSAYCPALRAIEQLASLGDPARRVGYVLRALRNVKRPLDPILKQSMA